jgi:diacylglycerol O-acyltransferase / wax synthase
VAYERLNAQDAALLCAQDPAAPLQIGAVALFDRTPLVRDGAGIDLARIRRHVEGRLGRLPRFRQKLVPVAFDQGPPVWVDDPDFDIVDHVKTASLPEPGSQRELRSFVVRLLEQPLDDRRPLWELWFVDLPGGPGGTIGDDQVAVVLKASHVMADGIALLGFAWVLLDPDPRPGSDETDRPAPSATVDHAPRASLPRPGRLWIETAFARGRHDVALLARAATGALRPMQLVRGTTTLVRGLAATLVTAPDLAITRPVGTRRNFSWLRLSLDDMRKVAATLDVTVNDVVLSIVSAGLEDYLQPRRRSGRSKGPRVVVPVSTHEAGDLANLGNNFAMMIADLPEDGLDPVPRLRAVHESTSKSKASGQTSLTQLLFGASELVPIWLLRRVGPTLIRHQPFANLTVTNMPGSPDPLYLLGARMRELYPFITVTGNLGLIVGVLSYLDELALSLTVDADVVPDLDRLTAAMAVAADALVAQATGQP